MGRLWRTTWRIAFETRLRIQVDFFEDLHCDFVGILVTHCCGCIDNPPYNATLSHMYIYSKRKRHPQVVHTFKLTLKNLGGVIFPTLFTRSFVHPGTIHHSIGIGLFLQCKFHPMKIRHWRHCQMLNVETELNHTTE